MIHSAQSTGQEPLVGLETLAQLAARGAWRVTLPHARDNHMFLWITRGQGRALIDGVRRGFGPNNVLWLPAGTQFTLELSSNVFGQALTYRRADPSLLSLEPQHLRIRDVSLQGELGGLVELIHREVQAPQPFQDDALLAKFGLIEVWMRRMMLLVGEADDKVQRALPARQTAAHRLARAFAKAAERDFKTGRSMAEFAGELAVTPTHLTRVCREVTGMTAADLLTDRTLHEARKLLCDTDVPARQIAQHLGFGSAAYFSRFILKHTGQAPSVLRKNI